MAVTVGTGSVTVKAPGNIADCPSVLVTSTPYRPADVAEEAGSASMQVIFVPDESTVTEVAVTFGDPVFVRFTVAPGRNPVPVRFVIGYDLPATPVAGEMPVTFGASIYVKLSASDAMLVPMGVVTVIWTVPTERAGEVMVMVVPSSVTV
jgi:hypothetical protein